MTSIDPTTNPEATSRRKSPRPAKAPALVAAIKPAPVTGPTSPTVRSPGKTAAQPTSKSATVIKLLSRAKGATVAELMAETGWQPHSVRAYFTGLRKKGHMLVREQRKGGEQAYRIDQPAVVAASAGAAMASVAEPPTGTDLPQTGNA